MKPFLGIYFTCAGAYARAYENPLGTAYQGSCPQCGRTFTVGIAENGARGRQFLMSCRNPGGVLRVVPHPPNSRPH